MADNQDKQTDSIGFGPSKLGRKEHWDDIYTREIQNYTESGLIGHIWFGEDIEDKMIDWLADNEDAISKDSRILDVGCGNGHILFKLEAEGYTNLSGSDYSEHAISLTAQVARSKEPGSSVQFYKQDILDAEQIRKEAFDVVLDKGTFDAISLMEDGEQMGSRYVDGVAGSLCKGGVLLITSCNWIEEELCEKLGRRFEFLDRVKHRSFKFGGKVGQPVTTVAFKRIR